MPGFKTMGNSNPIVNPFNILNVVNPPQRRVCVYVYVCTCCETLIQRSVHVHISSVYTLSAPHCKQRTHTYKYTYSLPAVIHTTTQWQLVLVYNGQKGSPPIAHRVISDAKSLRHS